MWAMFFTTSSTEILDNMISIREIEKITLAELVFMKEPKWSTPWERET